METLPNPFGGVNTHLKGTVAYMLGIVRFSISFYTSSSSDGVSIFLTIYSSQDYAFGYH